MVAHRHNLFERMFGKVHAKAMSYQTKIHYWYCRVNKAIQMKEIEKRILNKEFSYKVDKILLIQMAVMRVTLRINPDRSKPTNTWIFCFI